MKVIIAGSRDMPDALRQVDRAVNGSGFTLSEVVSGCSGNVDTAGLFWAGVAGLPTKKFKADWKKHGRKAGPLRNQQMAEYADALIAVHDGKSKGTADMIRQAIAQGLSVYVFLVPGGAP